MEEGFVAVGHLLLLTLGSAVLGAIVGWVCGKRILFQVIANIILSFAICICLEWLNGNLNRWPPQIDGYYLMQLGFFCLLFVSGPMVCAGLFLQVRCRRT